MESHDNSPAMLQLLASQLSYNANKVRIVLLFIIVCTVVYPIISSSTMAGLPDPQHINQSIYSPCAFWSVWNALFLFQTPLHRVI